jgi:hypothetical protein
VAVGIFSHSHLVLDPTHSGFMGVSINGGTPISGSKWMVYFMENTINKWMRTGSTPISGNPHIGKNTGIKATKKR